MEIKIVLFVVIVVFPVAVTTGAVLFVKHVRRKQLAALKRQQGTIELMNELITERDELLEMYREKEINTYR